MHLMLMQGIFAPRVHRLFHISKFPEYLRFSKPLYWGYSRTKCWGR